MGHRDWKMLIQRECPICIDVQIPVCHLGDERPQLSIRPMDLRDSDALETVNGVSFKLSEELFDKFVVDRGRQELCQV